MSNDDDQLSPEEIQRIVNTAIGELLNIAAGVAELQTTDEAAEEIYTICDLVAEYFEIERAQAITVEHDDGSFTTRFEPYTGSTPEPARAVRSEPIPGSIRTHGRRNFRILPGNDNDNK